MDIANSENSKEENINNCLNCNTSISEDAQKNIIISAVNVDGVKKTSILVKYL